MEILKRQAQENFCMEYMSKMDGREMPCVHQESING